MKTKRNNSHRTRFNAADACILLILLAVLLVAVFFLFFADRVPFGAWGEGQESRTVNYTLEIQAVDNDLLDDSGRLPMTRGEALYHIDESFALGKVISVSDAKPFMAPTSFTDSKGELIYAAYPNKSSFTVTVEAQALFVDGAYQIDGKTLRIGDSFTMATPFFTATAYCKAIEEVTDHE